MIIIYYPIYTRRQQQYADAVLNLPVLAGEGSISSPASSPKKDVFCTNLRFRKKNIKT